MKNMMLTMLAALLLFPLAGCSTEDNAQKETTPEETTPGGNNSSEENDSTGVNNPSGEDDPTGGQGNPSEGGTSGSRSLVVFYTFSQNTASVAKRVAALTGADLYEVRTVKPYPNDPYETADISIEERRSGHLPEIVDDLPDLSAYEQIFIGGPIWNAYLATPLEKYLE